MLNELLETYGLWAVFVVMLFKEMGIPLPLPADLIMLSVAAQTAQGRFPFALSFAVILVPMLIGGCVQFLFARGPGRRLVYRVGCWIGLTELRLNQMMSRVQRGGAAAVAIGLSTPGVRIATTPASGLANLAAMRYFPGLLLGSMIFLGWHFALGYAGGVAIQQLRISPPVLLAVVIVVLTFGLLVAAINRHRRQAQQGELPNRASYAEWANAACPVCAAAHLLQLQTHLQIP